MPDFKTESIDVAVDAIVGGKVQATGDVEGDNGTFTSGATVGGVGVALRSTELDSGEQVLAAPFTSAGGGTWEDVDTLSLALSLDGSVMAVASVEAEAAAAAAVNAKFRLSIGGVAGPEIGIDLLVTQDALCVPLNHLATGLTAGAIPVVLQVQDDGVTAVTVSTGIISAIALVQK